MSGKYLISALPGQLHGEVRTQNITISGTGPTALPVDPLPGRKDFAVQNKTGVSIWLGGADVTAASGIELLNDATWSAQLGRTVLYAITASTTVSGVRVMEIA
jgi:hypothetical protein